jgi:uncharacterized protein (DUF924 family)
VIILLDQFTRNAFRGSPNAYAFDHRARELCHDGLALGADRHLTPVERLFFYLPLLHSEHLPDQQRSVACFAQLLPQTPPHQQHYFASWLAIARRCRRTIRLFGRFPHRNPILNRPSTIAERAWMALPALPRRR